MRTPSYLAQIFIEPCYTQHCGRELCRDYVNVIAVMCSQGLQNVQERGKCSPDYGSSMRSTMPALRIIRMSPHYSWTVMFSRRLHNDRAPLASEKKSPLPHPRQEETKSFVQVDEKEESSISKNRQASQKPSRKKRTPVTPQSARRDLLSV